MYKASTQSISIFYPCYNDATSIKKLIQDTYRIIPNLTKKYEAIVIDDGSTNNSHDERMHGQSQFFQSKHLLTIFFELCSLWWSLMVRNHTIDHRSKLKKILNSFVSKDLNNTP